MRVEQNIRDAREGVVAKLRRLDWSNALQPLTAGLNSTYDSEKWVAVLLHRLRRQGKRNQFQLYGGAARLKRRCRKVSMLRRQRR